MRVASSQLSRSLRVPRTADRHLLSRFSYGVTPALTREARQLGGADAWFRRQLNYTKIDDSAANELRTWFPMVWDDPRTMYRRSENGSYPGWEVSWDFTAWTILRRMLSRRQLHESMVDFWSNLLHISSPHHPSWLFRGSYDTVIRRHALGRFDAMLHAAITHPAMGLYLDNATSTKVKPNENLGREVLELHTVGPGSGYTEEEVKQSAYILTGYSVDSWDTWRARYVPSDHWTGRVNVLGFTDANADSDGRDVTRRYLRYLAHHPATARRIARRMAVRFVSDDPSPGLVTHVANAYLAHDTDIKATLRALVNHEEFKDSVGQKIRTPSEDAIATYRVLGVRPRRPTGRRSFGYGVVVQATQMGQRPFDWPRPDGFPDVAEAWTSVSRVLNSFQVHLNVVGGYAFPDDARYRSPQSFLPDLPSSLGGVVDHVSRLLLARPATRTLKASVAHRLDLPLDFRVRNRDDMAEWRMIPLLHTVLNTPQHMSR